MYRYGIGHTIGHIACFFIMAVLLGWIARTLWQRAIVAGGILFFAAVTEFLQIISTDMHFEWKDFRADALGMVLGMLLLPLIRRRRLSGDEVSANPVPALDPREPSVG